MQPARLLPTAGGLESLSHGLKFDSAYSCADSSPADTLQRCELRRIAGAYRAGTEVGTALRPSPREPPNPTDVVPALRV